jgi:ABC-type branched-subunit amino acid transport system ATPase component
MRLEVENLSGGYGLTIIVREVSFTLPNGAALAIVGRNGMGKTTLLRAILGYLRTVSGVVKMDETDVLGQPTFQIIRQGIAYAPQEEALFGELTVEENLRSSTLGKVRSAPRWSEIIEAFPRLGERLSQRAGTLSGGEQKMLLLARALLAEPKLLVLDEISGGLQPAMVQHVCDVLRHEREQRGTTMLMVEQNLDLSLAVADRIGLLKLGQLVTQCAATEDERPRLMDELAL